MESSVLTAVNDSNIKANVCSSAASSWSSMVTTTRVSGLSKEDKPARPAVNGWNTRASGCSNRVNAGRTGGRGRDILVQGKPDAAAGLAGLSVELPFLGDDARR